MAEDVHADEDDGERAEEAVEVEHPGGLRLAGDPARRGGGPTRRMRSRAPTTRGRRPARCTTRTASSSQVLLEARQLDHVAGVGHEHAGGAGSFGDLGRAVGSGDERGLGQHLGRGGAARR